MTMHVNIAEAKTRLSELVNAAVGGQDVVLNRAGKPQVRLVPVTQSTDDERADLLRRRRSALGLWKGLIAEEDSIVPPSMTDAEVEERWQRKFGSPS